MCPRMENKKIITINDLLFVKNNFTNTNLLGIQGIFIKFYLCSLPVSVWRQI